MTPKNDASVLQVGKIGKTIGLNGGLNFILTTDFPQSIQKNLTLTLVFPSKFSSSSQSYTIKDFNPKKSVIFFEGIDDIDKAKMLTNALAYATIEDTRKRCKLQKDEYFWFELIGFKILENEEMLGIIKDIDRIGTTDYLVVETAKNLIDEKLAKIFLIPYIDVFIISTSLEEKSIFVKGAKAILEAS